MIVSPNSSRAMRACPACRRFGLIRRLLGEFPHGTIARQDRDRISAALDIPRQLHELTAHPRYATHQLALVRQRQADLRVVRKRV
jgi:hypothetical protein